MDTDRLLDSFLAYLKIRGFSQNTVSSYANDLKEFVEFLSGRKITKKLVFDYIEDRLTKRYRPSTVNRKLSSIRAFLRFILKKDRLDISPKEIKNIRYRRQPPGYLPYSVLKGFFSNDRDGLIMLLLYAGGLRVSELINLRISDIMFQEGFIRLKGKGSKERIVPISVNVLRRIEEYIRSEREVLKGSRSTDYLFLSKRGSKLTRQAVWKIIKKKTLSSGFDIHPHDLRHSFATHMIENGASLKAVQEMLGHESITTTQIYTEISDKALEDAFHRLEMFE